MARFVKGAVVVLPFPFSDLSQVKRRPALVLAETSRDDLLICQITSQRNHASAIEISSGDFQSGGLRHSSYVRPDRVLTVDARIIAYDVGTLTEAVVSRVIEKIVALLRGEQ